MDASDIAAIEHGLTENALMFLRRSVEAMQNDPDGIDATEDFTITEGVAFAVVDLAVAVEVLLKARLVRKDWKLVCEWNPAKVTEKQLEELFLSGSAKTINPKNAIKLLNESCDVDLVANGHDARVHHIGELRNRAVHFTLNHGTLPIGAQAAYGSALDFALWFLKAEFLGSSGSPTEDLIDDVMQEIAERLSEINALVTERMASIADELDEAEECLECPRCHQATLMFIEQEPIRCAFCLWSPVDGDAAALEYVHNVKELDEYTELTSGGEWPIGACVFCSDTALVAGVVSQRERPHDAGALNCDGQVRPYWACFSCGRTAGFTEIERCTHCDTPTTSGDGGAICDDCFSIVVESD
ncbi:hypothetical protein OG563_26570 [Nocardia vinacea]|uniref:DUF4145 domain-containing protein n=1 Tax=Nocardia vinacea TaxID=96468 RepID=A0ABZ1YHX0_9NOCA|nr:hypothetical protein [Nocardia vinacea]